MSDRRYRLVVFDWDGTLVDSIGSIVACMRAALEEAGVTPPPEAVIRGAVGLGLTEIFQRFYPSADAATRERIHVAYRDHWIATWHSRHDAFPAVPAVLSSLTDAGVLLAVATAKSRRGLVRDFERTGLDRWFLATRTVDECPAKPSPVMLLELMDELGASPEETLMVGDSRWDLEMARNAGVDSVAVLGGAHPHEELLDCNPVCCLHNVELLPGWLGLAAATAADAERDGGAYAPRQLVSER
jgi:phosphoglycolate phosphatase